MANYDSIIDQHKLRSIIPVRLNVSDACLLVVINYCLSERKCTQFSFNYWSQSLERKRKWKYVREIHNNVLPTVN
jgi:hypothetical protein